MSDRITQHPSRDDQCKPRLPLIPPAHLLSEIVPGTFFLIDLEKPKVRPSWMTEKQFAQAPSRLTVRELQVGGKTLVTTLLCAKLIPKGELKSLYRQRWHVELNFRHLKTTMGMEMLASKSPAMAIKGKRPPSTSSLSPA